MLVIAVVIPNYPDIEASPIYLFVGLVVYKVEIIKGPEFPIAAGDSTPTISIWIYYNKLAELGYPFSTYIIFGDIN